MSLIEFLKATVLDLVPLSHSGVLIMYFTMKTYFSYLSDISKSLNFCVHRINKAASSRGELRWLYVPVSCVEDANFLG